MEAIYLLASQIQLEKQNYDAASKLIDQALEINPNYAKAYLARGDLYYAKASAANFDPNLLQSAMRYYNEDSMLRDQPAGACIPFKTHLAMANLILSEAQQTQDPELFQKAEEYYTAVIKEYEQTLDPILRPDAAIAYFGLGTVHKKQGELQQALQAYQKAYDLANNEEFKANVQIKIQVIQK